MSQSTLSLLEVDRLEIVSLMDNTYDATLGGNEFAQRAPRRSDTFTGAQPRAEHGFSMLLTVSWGTHRQSLLLDTGISADGVLHNLDALGLAPISPRAIVLSHGHIDHTGGLRALLRRFGTDVPVYLHPDAFLNRRVMLPDGQEMRFPPPDKAALTADGVTLVAQREPSLLLDGHVLLTGEVPRTTDYERGLPPQQAEIDGQWQADPATKDDQALVINVRDQGLVVVTGCGHAGIVNILRYAPALTGVDVLYGLIGGFHLGGLLFEQIIPLTVAELEQRAPQMIVPCHCTGWKAVAAIAAALPWAFIQNSVGTTYRL